MLQRRLVVLWGLDCTLFWLTWFGFGSGLVLGL